MKDESVLAPLLATWGLAEAGARTLSPREPPRPPLPVDLADYFTDEEIERGYRFARPQRALALAAHAVEIGLLGWLALRPPAVLRARRASPLVTAAATGASLTVVLSIPPLPLRALARRRAIRVGLVTQAWRGWAVDLVKVTAIEAALAAAAGGLVMAAIRRFPRGWWLVAGSGSVALSAVLAAVAPVLLDPVFNRFTPLAAGQLRDDVLELAQRAGVKVGEVYSVDASRRTTAANAYVTGLGPTKRVVLFDTLLDRFDRDEVRVVVAHELAHVRFRDVWRGVIYGAAVAPAAALAVQRLSRRLTPHAEDPAGLPALALAATGVSVPVALVANRLSRAIERRADAFSLELSQTPESFVSFERKIALQNVADLDPPRWVSSLLATHPPTRERIGAAVAYLKQAGPPGPAP